MLVPKKVEILSKRTVFSKFIFRVDEVKLRHEKYDGTMSDPLMRLNLDRGDAVAGVIHLTDNDTILLTEQFRYPTYDSGSGWILEIPAGMVRKNEDPEAAMRRELLEETGFETKSVEYINSFFLSPGGTSERIHLYYAAVAAGDKIAEGGGVEHEGEDIRTVFVSVGDLARMVSEHELTDAKTLVGVQWLLMNLDRLRT